jgi:uncharacterized protein (DUF2252 family)
MPRIDNGPPTVPPVTATAGPATVDAPPTAPAPPPAPTPAAVFLRAPGSATFVPDPAQLTGAARAQHIKNALGQDNSYVAHKDPAGLERKLDALSQSPFRFFRGTSGLFYRDLAKTDATTPRVFANGDVHPENFGVMPGADGEPLFALNDFDESAPAPFTWDLRRGLVGFELSSRQKQLSGKQRRKVREAFVAGYERAMESFDGTRLEHVVRFVDGDSPEIIDDLIDSVKDKTQKAFLQKYVDADTGKLRASEEIVPASDLVPEMQQAAGLYLQRRQEMTGEAPPKITVLDVARKLSSGTGSLGLDRYFVLIKEEGGREERILEVKETRPSTLAGRTPDNPVSFRAQAMRITAAHELQIIGGDPRFGEMDLGGRSFVVRERSPYKESVDLEPLTPKELRDYARVCGSSLAQSHARADDWTQGERSVEKAVLRALDGETEALCDWADTAADGVERDYQSFVELRTQGEL